MFFNSANCIILPYQEVFTSGSALLAKTFGKFLITKDCEFMREYFKPETVLLSHFESQADILNAINKFFELKESILKNPLEIEKIEWEQLTS